MNPKLLLVNSISLLYFESQLEKQPENSAGLVRQIVQGIKLPEVSIGIDQSREILVSLKKTAIWMSEQGVDHVFELSELLQRLKVDTLDDIDLYESFKAGIPEPEHMTPVKLRRLVLNLKKTLNNHFREIKAQEIIQKASSDFSFKRDSIADVSQYIASLVAQLDPYAINTAVKDPAIVTDLSLDDMPKVTEIYQAVQEMDSGVGIMQLGMQGWNRMFQGGWRRGESGVISALQHNYKTGTTLTAFKQICLYNTPYMIDPEKKPMLLRISFEDSVEQNMQFLYQSLYENDTGLECSAEHVLSMKAEDIAKYVIDRLQATGYTVRLMRVDPTQWSYQHICNKIVELEAEGFEIHMLMLDYLKMVPTTGCTQGATGQDVRDLYRRMRNFTNPRKICLVTPHQMSTEAKQLVRNGETDLVKTVANKGYYDGCRTLDQEVDWEMYINIESVNNEFFLACQRGKHRGVRILDAQDKYCVLPMSKIGGLKDDINGPDTTRRKVGGGAIGSGAEVPFWDIADTESAVAH